MALLGFPGRWYGAGSRTGWLTRVEYNPGDVVVDAVEYRLLYPSVEDCSEEPLNEFRPVCVRLLTDKRGLNGAAVPAERPR